MSFAKIHSAQTTLLSAHQIDIEVDLSRGLHTFTVVGLGDKAVEESRDRVSAAIKNSGFIPPKQKNEKVVVSLAPAHIKKHGPLFDTAIAICYLLATKEIYFEPRHTLFIGELALDGKLRSVKGILPLIRFAKDSGFTEVFIPKENAKEAAVVDGIDIYGAETLEQIIDHIDMSDLMNNKKSEPKAKIQKQAVTKIIRDRNKIGSLADIDFSEIRGQSAAKRGLEIAAAGGHNIALYGPPGTGKTMLAKAFTGILPTLSFEDILDVTSIHSVAGTLNGSLITSAPFRSPHHSTSYVAICGGGSNIRPGEVTLAHKGVLFLDEFPEFERKVIESLRQPLEDNEITISRASGSARYPAEFILFATMNPCPCGYHESDIKVCKCSTMQIQRYQEKLSGPIIDRIDMWIEVGRVSYEDLLQKKISTKSESQIIRKRVEETREIQITRQEKLNSKINQKLLEKHAGLDKPVKEILKQASKTLDLSARSLHKVIRLARTIADLEKQEEISESHILEALQYRKR